MQPREWMALGADADGPEQGRVMAVYPATEGLSFKVVRSILDNNLDALLPLADEYLPKEILERGMVPGFRDALRMVHRPATLEEAHAGRSRLAFEELLFVQLLHHRARALARTPRAGIQFANKRDLTTRLRESLPYELTGAQVRAIREIVVDMCSDRRMHRL